MDPSQTDGAEKHAANAPPPEGAPASEPPSDLAAASITPVPTDERPVLKTLVLLGSARTSSAFWGGSSRLATRVGNFVQQALEARSTARHEITVWDPVELELPMLERPHFYYEPGTAPPKLDELARVVEAADCYVVVSCEYNHSIPPALSNMLDYFGQSRYAYKPSAICTYSDGPWGGMGAAVQLRSMLGELGCIPIQNMLRIATVSKVLDEDGGMVPGNGAGDWARRVDTFCAQLEWWAMAAKNQRAAAGRP